MTLAELALLLALVAHREDPLAPSSVMWTAVNRARTRGTSVELELQRPEQYKGLRVGSTPSAARRARLAALALRVLSDQKRDPTNGSTHFHRAGTRAPAWAPPPSEWTTLGSHHFYKERER